MRTLHEYMDVSLSRLFKERTHNYLNVDTDNAFSLIEESKRIQVCLLAEIAAYFSTSGCGRYFNPDKSHDFKCLFLMQTGFTRVD